MKIEMKTEGDVLVAYCDGKRVGGIVENDYGRYDSNVIPFPSTNDKRIDGEVKFDDLNFVRCFFRGVVESAYGISPQH